MFDNVRITNYRSLREITIPRLLRMNLVTGRNGGGKSSLLEAVFLNAAAASPIVPLSVAQFRSDAFFSQDDDSTFRAFFNDMNPTNTIQVVADHKELMKSRSRTLRIEAVLRPSQQVGRSTKQLTIGGLNIKFSGKSGNREAKVQVTFPPIIGARGPVQDPVKFEGPQDNPDVLLAQYISPYMRDVYKEIYDNLVTAVKNKTVSEVIDVLKLVSPDVRGLTPVSEQGQPRIYVDTGGNRLLPIAALGSGFLHVLRLALAVSFLQEGILLIDEIENGLHFSILREIATYLMGVSRNKKLQFFIATHSAEVIKSFDAAAKLQGFEELGLLNMSAAASRNQVRTFGRQDLEYAVELEAELRS